MCAPILVSSCKRTEEVTRDECVISIVGVRGDYGNGGMHMRDAYRGGGAEEGTR